MIQEATSSAQQQDRHVVYVEKKIRKKVPAQPQAPDQPQAPALHQAPAVRPFVPPKKKQKNSCDATGQSSSQQSSQPVSQTQVKKSSQTIPMSQVVTEQVPKYGRMNWLLGEKQKQGGDGQE